MVNQTQSASIPSSVSQANVRPPDAQSLAAAIIANNSQGGRRDVDAIKADLAAITAQNPMSAGALAQAIEAQLTPVERGQLASSTSLAQAPGGPSAASLALDITQIGLDIVGIFEPTPFADGANTLISLGRGDWLGAGLSVLGVVPYVGDLAKLGKLGKWAKTVANGIELAAKNPAAAKLLEPALRKVHDAIKAIPEGALKKLPDEAREAIQGMKKQLDEFFGAAKKTFSDTVTRTAERLGIPPDNVQSILSTEKGSRPDPSSYLPASRIAEHTKAFENGGSRFTLQSSLDKYGLGQRDGTTFILPKGEADRLLAAAAGDPRKLEAALGLPVGQLDSATLVRVDFSPKALDELNMRIPSGNEAGANTQWLPGGVLPSGANEAVIDGALAKPGQYSTTVIK
jgi:hypothetical protein